MEEERREQMRIKEGRFSLFYPSLGQGVINIQLFNMNLLGEDEKTRQ